MEITRGTAASAWWPPCMRLVVDTDVIVAAMRSSVGAPAALLMDAGDEMVLEAAVNGRADAIVMFNRRDYGQSQGLWGRAPAFWHPGCQPVRSTQGGTRVTTRLMTVSVKLPASLKAAIEELAAADGTTMNQFMVLAAAEKMTAMKTADKFFAQRRGQASCWP